MESAQPQHRVTRKLHGGWPGLIAALLALGLPPEASAVAQAAAPEREEKAIGSAALPFGAELALRSGHSDRGFLINDREGSPVTPDGGTKQFQIFPCLLRLVEFECGG